MIYNFHHSLLHAKSHKLYVIIWYTQCYVGEDGETYVSEEFAVMCGGQDFAGTCIIDDYVCLDPFIETTNAASKCVDDETCCTKEGWDEEGCLECMSLYANLRRYYK